jgi:transcriptional regulator with XRE-family HTH domain
MPKQIKNRFAEYLAIKIREEKRSITHADISTETGIAKATVGSYLRNDVQRPDLRVVATICHWLGIAPGDFWVWSVDEDGEESLEAEVRMPVPA